jgi:hypothetical protein
MVFACPKRLRGRGTGTEMAMAGNRIDVIGDGVGTAMVVYSSNSRTGYRGGSRRGLATEEYRAVSRPVYSRDVHELSSRMVVPSSQLSYMRDGDGIGG